MWTNEEPPGCSDRLLQPLSGCSARLWEPHDSQGSFLEVSICDMGGALEARTDNISSWLQRRPVLRRENPAVVAAPT